MLVSRVELHHYFSVGVVGGRSTCVLAAGLQSVVSSVHLVRLDVWSCLGGLYVRNEGALAAVRKFPSLDMVARLHRALGNVCFRSIYE